MDNPNTHKAALLYEAFDPKKAESLWDRFVFIYAPKHGSWLNNMAEIELNVLISQRPKRRIAKIETVCSEVKAWELQRNHSKTAVNRRFTTKDARIKLKRLCPIVKS